MKTYEVELMRVSYAVTEVQAENEDQAISLAFEDLDVHPSDHKFWDLSYCEETPCT